MARGHIIPDLEILALMDQGMADREIAVYYNKSYCNLKNRLNRIRSEHRARERARKRAASLTTYIMPADEVKARFGECGEYAEQLDFVSFDFEHATRMQRLRGSITVGENMGGAE